MSFKSGFKLWHIVGASIGAIVVAAGLSLFSDCEICEAANQILLQGTVAQNCTIDVTAAGAATNLPLTAGGSQHVQVGTVLQNCNKKIGYTLTVASLNCSAGTAGAKVVDPVSAEVLAYSAEFTNPTDGGSQADVTDLLQSACTSQVARDVTNWKARNETSTVFVNFTGDSGLAAGTYQDTLTITMNVK
jgi:hypothetical protein